MRHPTQRFVPGETPMASTTPLEKIFLFGISRFQISRGVVDTKIFLQKTH
jgi:hypothetical protein